MIKDNQKLLNFFHILIDAAIIVFAFSIAYHLRFNEETSYLLINNIIEGPRGVFGKYVEYMRLLILIVPLYIFSYYFFNLYNPKRMKNRRTEIFNLLKANVVGILYCTSALYFNNQTRVARLFIIIFFIINFLSDSIVRLIISFILKFFRKRGFNKKHVLLIGYSRATENYIDRILAHPEWGYKIHGILDNRRKIGKNYRGVYVIGKINGLPNLLEENTFDEIVITLGISEYENLERIVTVTEKSGVHTKFVPDYNNIIPTRPYTEDLDGLPVIHVRNIPLTSSFNRFFKRALDLFGATIALILFSVPMLIVSIIIKATSPGPLIFKQTRIGLHNGEFEMYKFRSMSVQDKKTEKKAWTVENDSRITPFGKFIRRTSLDELPQLINVLKGDMSLVGPRPERPFFVDIFKEEVPRYMIKHQVRPGLTGWAQVNGYRGDTSIRMRIDCDLYYIENWTMGLDMKIIVLTFFRGFINKNAY
ncbi:MAG TPA: undecaprenyl-phosphate glucose phosphotransferase [Ruminococcaceae bacterium]|nr:undecaprenyl-phosphate glucose phosphotransferase [Oscillospiraceae bacterium]